jgi:hypothetical protein
MDNCQGPCLHHCTAKIKYILIGLCVGVFLGFLLNILIQQLHFKKKNN